MKNTTDEEDKQYVITDWNDPKWEEWFKRYNSNNYDKVGGQLDSEKIENYDAWDKIMGKVDSIVEQGGDVDIHTFADTFIKSKMRESQIAKQLQEGIEADKKFLKQKEFEDIKVKILSLKGLVDMMDGDYCKHKENDLTFIDDCLKSIDEEITLNKRDLIVLNRLHTEYSAIKENNDKIEAELGRQNTIAELKDIAIRNNVVIVTGSQNHSSINTGVFGSSLSSAWPSSSSLVLDSTGTMTIKASVGTTSIDVATKEDVETIFHKLMKEMKTKQDA